MAHEIVFRSTAKADLKGINEHIAEDSPQRADDFVDMIERRCRSLSEFPEMGRRRDDLGSGVRLLAFDRRVAVIYRVTSTVEILRVHYGGRDYEALGDVEGPER